MKRIITMLSFLIFSSFFIIQTAEIIPAIDKLEFDNAVKAKDINTIITILTSEEEKDEVLRNSYPLAMKLYRILSEFSAGEDFTNEARYIPIESIVVIAKALAIEGNNTRFLRNIPR